jgi:hypothetical protein
MRLINLIIIAEFNLIELNLIEQLILTGLFSLIKLDGFLSLINFMNHVSVILFSALQNALLI